MKGRERVVALLDNRPSDRAGFWLGNPTDETMEIYYRFFGVEGGGGEGETTALISSGQAALELSLKLGSDFMWYSPELDPEAWQHPQGKPLFDTSGGKEIRALSQPGVLADCQDIREAEKFAWPDPAYLDFNPTLKKVEEARCKGLAVFGGMWMPFFHVLCDLFGMENYFIKMHMQPDIIEAATERLLEFYLEANRRCLTVMGSKLDAVFFGNDLGSQQDLLISPEAFRKFILPGITRIVSQAKGYGLKVVLHSCGAISRIIPDLIEAGIDGLHPLQAQARGMEAGKLAREYREDLLFIGGVDTQRLLPFASPEEVEREVLRLIETFGERYIVSPSHEAILPNVSPENVIAMRRALG